MISFGDQVLKRHSDDVSRAIGIDWMVGRMRRIGFRVVAGTISGQQKPAGRRKNKEDDLCSHDVDMSGDARLMMKVGEDDADANGYC